MDYKQAVSPCRASISSIQGPFLQLLQVVISLEPRLKSLLIGGCGSSHNLLRTTKINTGFSFEPNSLRKLKTMFKDVEAENDLEMLCVVERVK